MLANKDYPISDRVIAAYKMLSALTPGTHSQVKPSAVLRQVGVSGADRDSLETPRLVHAFHFL